VCWAKNFLYNHWRTGLIRELLLLRHTHEREFSLNCMESFIPCLQNIARLNSLRSGGPLSVPDNIWNHKKTVTTDDKPENIQARLHVSRLKCVRHFSEDTGMSVGCDPAATKLIKFHPYRVRAVQYLNPKMFHKVFRFVTECWKICTMDCYADPQLLFINDEAIFLFKRSCKLSRITREKCPHNSSDSVIWLCAVCSYCKL
jgi:hypothetical protein